MKAQGSALGPKHKHLRACKGGIAVFVIKLEAHQGRNVYFAPLGLVTSSVGYQGRRALRFAPGSHCIVGPSGLTNKRTCCISASNTRI